MLIPSGSDGLILELGHPAKYSFSNPDRLTQLDVWMTGDEKPVSVLSGITKSSTDHTVLDLRALTGGRSVALVSGQYDNGYWVTLPGDKHFNTSKLHMSGVSIAVSSSNSGRRYFLGLASMEDTTGGSAPWHCATRGCANSQIAEFVFAISRRFVRGIFPWITIGVPPVKFRHRHSGRTESLQYSLIPDPLKGAID